MRAPLRPDRTQPTSRRILVLVAMAVIMPGFVLSVLGIITLRQDRGLADQQVRERRDVLADRAVAALETEWRGWTSALAATQPDVGAAPAAFPPLLRHAIEQSDLAVFVASGRDGTRTWPERRLLYEGDASSASARTSPPLSPALAAAERVELEQRDLPRAAVAYRTLQHAADPAARAAVLVRLARTYRNSGREDLAASTYRDLERLAGTIVSGVPADLLMRPMVQGFFDEMVHLLAAGFADLLDRPFDSFIDPGGQLSLGHDVLLDCVYYQEIAVVSTRRQQPFGSTVVHVRRVQ